MPLTWSPQSTHLQNQTQALEEVASISSVRGLGSREDSQGSFLGGLLLRCFTAQLRLLK